MDIQVDCVAGPAGEPQPHRLRLGTTEVVVTDVLDHWPGVGHRYYKVRAADGGLYIVRHDTAANAWRMTFFQAADIVWPGDLPPGRS